MALSIADLKMQPMTEEEKQRFVEDMNETMRVNRERQEEQSRRDFQQMQEIQTHHQRNYEEIQIGIQVEASRRIEAEKQATTQPQAVSDESKQSIKKISKVSPIFSEFKNLRAREIAFVMLENETAQITIRGKKITVTSDELGLSPRDWTLLAGASVNSGDLTNALKKINKTSDPDKGKQNIKTTISRIRKNLKETMGLQSNPIILNGTYKFTFRIMTHELLDGINVTKSPDAMTPNYRSNKEFDENELSINDDHEDDSENNSFWSDDEPDEYY